MAELLDEGLPHLKAVELFEKIKQREVDLHEDAVFDCVLEATNSQRLAEAYRNAVQNARRKNQQPRG